jgi:pimeloyl-ACP methyl ester carboxylesterase
MLDNKQSISYTYISAKISLLLLLCTMASCFRGHVITERQIRKHYATKDHKPAVYTIDNDSISLSVASIGSDTLPMLLLIHGAPGSLWGYLNFLDDTDLQKHYHIVSVDRLGYGKSRYKKHKSVTSIDMQAAALIPVLSLNKSAEKMTVLGRSYGAPIAARLVSMVSESVKELVMVSPVIDPDKEKFYWFSKLGKNSIIKFFLPHEFNVATDEKYSHIKELRKLLPIWKSISVPTTVIQGGKDWIGDPANIDFARRQIKSKSVQFIFLDNAGHMITQTHASLVKDILLRSHHKKRRKDAIALDNPPAIDIH